MIAQSLSENAFHHPGSGVAPSGSRKPKSQMSGKSSKVAELLLPVSVNTSGGRPSPGILITGISSSAKQLSSPVSAGCTHTFGSQSGLTERVSGGNTAGVAYETVSHLTGVEQLDLLDDEHALVIARNDDGVASLQSVALP